MANTSQVELVEEENEGPVVLEISRYSQLTGYHTNPLLHNKGFANAQKNLLAPNNSVILSYLPISQQNDVITSAFQLPQVTNNTIDIHKKDTIMSEAQMSNISELDANDQIAKANNMLLLTEEIKSNIQELVHNELIAFWSPEEDKDDTIKKKRDSLTQLARIPLKCRTMATYQKQSFDKLGVDLTPEQFQYFKKMYAIKENYLFHALGMKEIYIQYVQTSREDMSFINSESFSAKMDWLLKQRKNYARDIAVYKGIFTFITLIDKKTLALDLDETLAFASGVSMQNYNIQLTYIASSYTELQVLYLLI